MVAFAAVHLLLGSSSFVSAFIVSDRVRIPWWSHTEYCCNSVQHHDWGPLSASTPRNEPEATTVADTDASGRHRANSRWKRVLIHWKGEDKEKYTFRFRHDELQAAVAATTNSSSSFHLTFRDALCYMGNRMTSEVSRVAYNQAMQYVDFTSSDATEYSMDLTRVIQTAVERCSLIHAAYEIVAETESASLSTNDSHREMSDPEAFERLAQQALSNGHLAAHLDQSTSWCVRLRDYSNDRTDRQGYRARSMTHERAALTAMAPLLRTIPGPVDLDNPDCKLYVLNGVLSSVINSTTTATSLLLTRRLAGGLPRLSTLNPNTRICVTTTPLCPTAAVLLCNMARLQPHHRIWDPYGGSGTVLLAAAFMFPKTITTMGTEIDPSINVNEIRADFRTRHLTPPAVWVTGDCSSASTIDAIGTVDAIVTDPPYGIREALVATTTNPDGDDSSHLVQRQPIYTLLDMIRKGRRQNKRLLRVGGRLVVLLPHRPDDQDLHADVLPHPDAVAQAGLRCELYREQQLNERLSRWLVSYVSVE